MNKPRVLLAIESAEPKKLVSSSLESQQYEVGELVIETDAKKYITENKCDFVILEQGLSTFDISSFVKEIRKSSDASETHRNVPIFILGNDAKKYHTNFKEIDYCKLIFDPDSVNDFTKSFLNYPGKMDIIGKDTRHLTKGEFLIDEGSESNEMYWVLAGKFNITKKSEEGENVVIGEANTGELVGEMSFLDALPRSASVKAIEESDVLVIPHDRFVMLFDGQPTWFRSLMRTLSRRLRGANMVIAEQKKGNDAMVELAQDDINALIQQGLTEGF